MGFDLTGRGGYFRWTASGWTELLQLAEEYGWHPIGTGAPRGTRKHDWPGIYHSNDGQLFYARDASQLADALCRFLDTTTNPPASKKRGRGNPSDSFLQTPEGRNSLREFIAFCRAGSFRLH